MNLQKLQTQRERERHRRFIVRYLQKIEEAKEDDSMVEFDAIIATIDGNVKILETLNDKIVSQTDADGTEEQRNNNGLNPDATVHPESVSNLSSSHSTQYYRLPKISLPSFSGDILLWQFFWDSYESTIHSNVNLTDVQKFTYLKS